MKEMKKQLLVTFTSLLFIVVMLSNLFSSDCVYASVGIEKQERAVVQVGVDRLFSSSYRYLLEKKRVGLITNHTAINKNFEKTCDVFVKEHERGTFRLQALFAPEHGLMGEMYAGEAVKETTYKNIPVISLHGTTRRPTREMLQGIEVLVYDIQDLGSRSYTFATTLLYCMEEAAKWNIKVVVLDRPNPLGGMIAEGPMLEEPFRSFVGYINVPYRHGMTIGELARYFNAEYKVGASLTVVPMLGWKRSMLFSDTGLPWIPTSPNIPEASTALLYPATGIIGELGFVNIGVGYTLPFKIITAPWIDPQRFVKELNRGASPFVRFQEIWVKPYGGQFSGKKCQGALLLPLSKSFSPIETCYQILDTLKRLYPKELLGVLSQKEKKKQLDMFYKVCGTKKIAEILIREKRPFDALCSLHHKERAEFMEKRKQYLIPSYGEK